MESRLLPVNALIALCSLGDPYPSVLARAGYQLAGIEVPVGAGEGRRPGGRRESGGAQMRLFGDLTDEFLQGNGMTIEREDEE